MTSKIFKSTATNRTLTVEGHFNGAFAVVFSDDSSLDLMLQGGDAPALALAVLEAAGWPNEHLATTEIMRRLRELDEHVKAVEAEARERAELEAEALELVNAWRAEGGEKLLERWDAEEGDMIQSKPFWLAVARRAREIAKEATK